jgi:hypothetical protein
MEEIMGILGRTVVAYGDSEITSNEVSLLKFIPDESNDSLVVEDLVALKDAHPQKVFDFLEKHAPKADKPLLDSLVKRHADAGDYDVEMMRKFIRDVGCTERNAFACIAALVMFDGQHKRTIDQVNMTMVDWLIDRFGYKDARVISWYLWILDTLGNFVPYSGNVTHAPWLTYFNICLREHMDTSPLRFYISEPIVDSVSETSLARISPYDSSAMFTIRDGYSNVRCTRQHPGRLCTPDHWHDDWVDFSTLVREYEAILDKITKIDVDIFALRQS